MHSAVMQNKKYIEFADENTVEVLSLSRLDEARQKSDPKAATYTDDDGVEKMVQWPSLTFDQIVELNRSKAGTYNNTGKIPYTCIVDPHTLKELGNGYSSAKSIQDAVEGFRKEMIKEHGKGISRKIIRDLDAAIAESKQMTAKGDYSKALKNLDKALKNPQDAPTELQDRLAAAKAEVLAAARAKIDEALKLDRVLALRELRLLARDLRGTELEAVIEQHMKDLSEQE